MSLALCRAAIDTEGRDRALDTSGELRIAPEPGRDDAWRCELSSAVQSRVHRFSVYLTPSDDPERPAIAACSLDKWGAAFALFAPTPSLWA